MIKKESRKARRRARAKHVRRFVNGSAERPRLCVRVTNRWIYAQLVDDEAARVVATATTQKKGVKSAKKVADATALGGAIAGIAKEKGIQAVVFDRGGAKYHGRLKALADAARKNGMRF